MSKHHECACHLCGCDRPATTTDDGGNAVCDECATYTDPGDGTIVCSRQTDGFTKCHECGESIDWGSILTGHPGTSNYRPGDCGCGVHSWTNAENGGDWDRYSYGVSVGETS